MFLDSSNSQSPFQILLPMFKINCSPPPSFCFYRYSLSPLVSLVPLMMALALWMGPSQMTLEIHLLSRLYLIILTESPWPYWARDSYLARGELSQTNNDCWISLGYAGQAPPHYWNSMAYTYKFHFYMKTLRSRVLCWVTLFIHSNDIYWMFSMW